MRRQRSLKTLLLMAFLPVVVLPILLAALVMQWQYQVEIRTIEANIQQDLLVTARSREKLLGALIDNALDQAQLFAVAWPYLGEATRNRALAAFNDRSQAFGQVWVASARGSVRYASESDALGRDLSTEPYWQAYQRTGAVTISDPEVESGRRVVRLVLPISSGEALVASYRLSQLQNALRDPETVGLDRFSFLVDRRGRVLAHPDERIQAAGQDLSGLPPVERAKKGREGTMVFRDPVTHQERSAVHVPLEKLGWSLVAIQPAASTMLVSPTQAHRQTLLILAVGLLLAAWMTAVLSRRLARPVEEFGANLRRLSEEPIRPGQADRLIDENLGVAEYDVVARRAKALYDALADTIVQLEARSNELSLANQQTEATVEALKRLDRLRADFLDALSHDLRIPVTSIIGYAELLQDAQDPPLGATELTYVQQILEGCKRMQDMLEELLDYARMEVGRIKLRLEPVDPYALIDETLAFFRPLASQKHLRLEARLPEQLPDVVVDPDRLRQILNNLISNAVKYTPPGGGVTVRAGVEDGCVVFEIQDTGIGLSDEDKAHLFEKFYRSSRAEVQREKGSGLGLALIKGVIEAHDGHIEVDSSLGKGSIFRFTLPASQPTTESSVRTR